MQEAQTLALLAFINLCALRLFAVQRSYCNRVIRVYLYLQLQTGAAVKQTFKNSFVNFVSFVVKKVLAVVQ